MVLYRGIRCKIKRIKMKNKFLETGEHGYHPVRKFKIILSGLRFAVLYDFSVMYKIVVSIAILIPVVIFNEWIDASLIILATGVMLTAELFNTAIEKPVTMKKFVLSRILPQPLPESLFLYGWHSFA
jgi:hypothetical protein